MPQVRFNSELRRFEEQTDQGWGDIKEMDKVRVEKARLLAELTTNRETHKNEVTSAQKIFQKQLIAELEAKLAIAKQDRKVSLHIEATPPECHLDDFDAAIKRVEMSVDSTLEVTFTQFDNWVMNKWNWSASYALQTQSKLR